MNVTGKTTIYRRDFTNGTAYSRKVSFKDPQGTWYNLYEPVTFKGGAELENRTEIRVTDAFESGYLDSKGSPQRKLVIMAWEIEEAPTDFETLNESVPF